MEVKIKVKELNLELKEILEAIPYGVAFLDGDLNLVLMNSFLETLTGYKSEEIRGIEFCYVLKVNVFKEIKKVIKDNEGPVSLEGDLIDLNRKKIPVRIRVSPLSFDGSKWVILVLEDISLIKEKSTLFFPDKTEAILGNSPAIVKIKEMLPVFASSDATLLIEGETGTGKDLLAEVIHKLSPRANNPFIKVNCGALPETLLESELFGHVKGAFTGATLDKPGMFKLANGGTLFLTEIGDLPLNLQVKLLTFLDDKEFYPLGSTKKVKVDVRVIAATNRNLKQMVKEGKFREDLFYRLNVLRIQLPPLRERGDDILILADYFLKEFLEKSNKKIKGFSEEVIKILKSYKYPGNVRELRNIIEYAVHVCSEDFISERHLPEYLVHSIKEDSEKKTMGKEENFFDLEKLNSENLTWEEIEKKRILEALISSGGKKTEAAKKLGWARSTLWRKLKEYGLVQK